MKIKRSDNAPELKEGEVPRPERTEFGDVVPGLILDVPDSLIPEAKRLIAESPDDWSATEEDVNAEESFAAFAKTVDAARTTAKENANKSPEPSTPLSERNADRGSTTNDATNRPSRGAERPASSARRRTSSKRK